MNPPPFQGWERPERNFYRLPLTWFATLTHLRRTWQLRSIANLIRLVEYIIRWTWGEGQFERPVRLTLDELEHGKVIGRRNGVRLRADEGCGISGSHLSEAIQLAVDLGLITREVDRRDPGRIRQYFAPRLAAPSATPSEEGRSASPSTPFPGFPLPHTNYFIVPKVWTSLMARTRSDTLILAMEYLMRHCWGWRARADEVHWLTADEVARGRQRADGTRYDDGIGYSVERTRDALERAVAEGWLVVRERASDGGRPVREYTLRRLGWPMGEWRPPEERRANEDAPPLHPMPLSDVSEGDTDLSERGADASAGGNDASEGDADLSAPRTDIPTPSTNCGDLSEEGSPPPNPDGGGGRCAATMTLHLTSLTDGHPVAASGPRWEPGRGLGPDEVLLAGEDGEGIIVVPASEAARLLAEGVDAASFGWEVGWWDADAPAETPAARARYARVLRQANLLRQRREAWGDDDLVRALARYDVAPETAARWIARWGEERVGAWLATLRRDPRVQTVAGLLLRKLQSGQTPPSWVVDPPSSSRRP